MSRFDFSETDDSSDSSDLDFSPPQRSSSRDVKTASVERQSRMYGSASTMKPNVKRASLDRKTKVKQEPKQGPKPSLERTTKKEEPPAILMITCGSAGSGKSTLIQETFRKILGKVPEFEMFLVDDLVENDPEYKKQVDEILKTNTCKPPFDSAECNASQPTEALVGAFKSAYFAVRSKEGCMQNAENLNCNELNDRNIMRALQAHKHVVIESTCSYIPAWVLDLKLENYKVVFSYSIVQFDVLLERNSSRASKSLTAYYGDRSKPGPRLIDIRKSTFLPIVTQIYSTLLDLRNLCMSDSNPKDSKCASKTSKISNVTVSNVLIFDNTGAKFKNIYDHTVKAHAEMSPLQFQSFIWTAFFGPDF